jgi:outer membrane protein OmpA-like peptidoglycan-associated protein
MSEFFNEPSESKDPLQRAEETRSFPPAPPPEAHSRAGLILGAVALALVLALGFWVIRSLRTLNRQITQLNSQTQQLNARVEHFEQQSQGFAQQASAAAASAQVAAQQRDEAQQDQQKSAEQAAAAQQQAAQAEQKAEEYRKQREQELQSLQQVLGQIAETRRTSLGLVMTLGEKSIRFDFDKSNVEPQYRDILNRIAGVLMTLQGYSIYVYGYTDDIGSQEYNAGLSERRAKAVRDFLVQAGIDSRIISTKGFGKSDPRVHGDTSQARAANRRVEIGIVDSTLVFENAGAPQN